MQQETALTAEEKAAQERKKAIIQAAMERARLKKEQMAPPANSAGIDDVSRSVRSQIDATNIRLDEQAKDKR